MKLLTVTVPCYNSEAYMQKCVDSLLTGGEEVEILIVDDGSHDKTAAIADQYEYDYPGIVRALHQENGGHGEALNTGIKNATGLYFIVVDSDDWVDASACKKVLDKLREFAASPSPVDLLTVNYVLEHADGRPSSVVRPTLIPKDKVIGWDKISKPKIGKYLAMHSVIYKTEVLRASGLILPKHTFYVDNLMVYLPLTYVKTLYYLDADLYRYFIGRGDQSVTNEMMIKRIDQHIRVNRAMIDSVDLEQVTPKRLRQYLFYDLEILTAITSVYLLMSKTQENIEKEDALWAYIKETKPETYKKLVHRFMGFMLTRKSPIFRKTSIAISVMVRKLRGN